MQRRHHRALVKRLAAITGLALALGGYCAGGAYAAQAPSDHCPSNAARIACVDLSHQVMWVQSHGRVTWGPVHVRSGARATPTRTGLWHIYRRARQHRSTINGRSMPYSQFFDGGIAFHGTTAPLNSPPGSLGCVTMTVPDSAALWLVTKTADPVYVFGRKPGT
jgi:lipoprotein-anchoring transpeptidase ErfK/SrfK